MHMGSQVHLYSHKPAKDTDADSWSYETPPEGSVDVRIVRKRCSPEHHELTELSRTIVHGSIAPLNFWTTGRKGSKGTIKNRLKRTGFYTFSKRLGVLHPCAQQNNQVHFKKV